MENDLAVGWCLIPPYILIRDDISPNQKILYGRIMGLIEQRGYCYASNKWLGEQIGLTDNRVSHLISDLQEKGLLKVNIIRKESGEFAERHITPLAHTENHLLKITRGMGENNNTPLVENNNQRGRDKRDRDLVLKGAPSSKGNFLSLFPQDFQDDRAFRKSWMEWLQYRKERKIPVTQMSVIKAVNKCKGFTAQEVIAAIDAAIDAQYRAFFPRKINKPIYRKQPDNIIIPDEEKLKQYARQPKTIIYS